MVHQQNECTNTPYEFSSTKRHIEDEVQLFNHTRSPRKEPQTIDEQPTILEASIGEECKDLKEPKQTLAMKHKTQKTEGFRIPHRLLRMQ